ncbi:MAG TPA: lipid A biosynthesis acyltransferase [Gammaproteobacteria bacterium]|nr:lipid A biosynthesis acyltransferase [Gammaproteobacteria bacterium]
MNAQPWLTHKEAGNPLAIRTIVVITRVCGHYAGYALLYPICLYFMLFRPSSVRASRQYLARVLGRRAGFRDIFRHHLTFASTVLDRVHLAGDSSALDIRVHGEGAIVPHLRARRGCLLLGAHLGSFEVMRVLADRYDIDIKALMYRRNATTISGISRKLEPSAENSLIEIGQPDTLLRVKEALEGGALVGILADRAISPDRTVTVQFLGSPVRLPAGPFLLADLLQAPMVLGFALSRGPRDYDVCFEELAVPDGVDGSREARLAAVAQRYADRVESHARRMPWNWFNFYDYWRTGRE